MIIKPGAAKFLVDHKRFYYVIQAETDRDKIRFKSEGLLQDRVLLKGGESLYAGVDDLVALIIRLMTGEEDLQLVRIGF